MEVGTACHVWQSHIYKDAGEHAASKKRKRNNWPRQFIRTCSKAAKDMGQSPGLQPSEGSEALRFKLGSIKGSKKSGFGLYVTPPKRLRIFEFLVRDQEGGGSNPLAPTNSFGTDNLQHAKERKTPWCSERRSIVKRTSRLPIAES